MPLESDSSRQLPLPGFERCQLPAGDLSAAAQGAEEQAAVPDERQLDLFAEGDARLGELLAEDLAPPWLACLGAVWRLWPAPPATELELGAFGEGIGREGAADEALGFWQCLRVAETPGCPEELLHEARRQMKKLRADLHALYLRRVRPADS